MKKIITLFAVIIMVAACKKSSPTIDKSSTSGLITDITDPGISSVRIGTQKWMTTNLAVTRYRNGDRIPQVKSDAKWAALTTGAWCWYNNDSANIVYGKLYNWYAVHDPRGLAPIGWHIPSDAEWDTLSTFLGGDAVAGGKIKETGTTHWIYPNGGATNSSGFTALPSGARGYTGMFWDVHQSSTWWSSTQVNTTANAWCRKVYYFDGGFYRGYTDIRYSISVRCVKN